MQKNKQTLTQKERRYDIDWLRIVLIFSVLLFHVGMVYRGSNEDWHIKSPQTSEWLHHLMVQLHIWRMPLLFFISGVGTYFALGIRNSRKYLAERTKRLFIPLLAGMFGIIVPIQVYIEFLLRGRFQGSFWDFYPTIFEWVPYPNGALSWHHLWFILYLFIYSLLALPLFLQLRTTKGKAFIKRLTRIASGKGALLLGVLPILLVKVLLKPHFPEETHALYNDWEYFTFGWMFFITGYMIASHQHFWDILKEQRRIFLIAWVLASAFLYYNYLATPKTWIFPKLPFDIRYWWISQTMVAWFSMLAVMGYGYRYLNIRHRWLKPLNQGVYPFYILHQPVIIVIGFFSVHWGLGVWAGFVVLTILSTVVSIGIYWWLVRPFALMRTLFGMKPKPTLKKESEPTPINQLA
ncbi:acyltransferase family protein [Microscilla marina]|uniref:Inner membrane protein n=1 Tax=Microscilla marina ATCC 23134 TaxID=313606 RepID=A1ZK66_MICM2|nr:acyltransferase [Microscilla marina]EAY29092.1 inner membrane protein [Microscilla marina ATCC 23134]